VRGAKRRSNLMVIDEIATLPTVARNDKRGLRHSLLRFAATKGKEINGYPAFARTPRFFGVLPKGRQFTENPDEIGGLQPTGGSFGRSELGNFRP